VARRSRGRGGGACEASTPVSSSEGCALSRKFPEGDGKASDLFGSESRSEADTAFRELQHRTKNNLQIIVGLLSIKRRQVRSQEAREVLNAAIRVTA
jgi:two-component sensor histidine kinase